jgi:hypothetical protein
MRKKTIKLCISLLLICWTAVKAEDFQFEIVIIDKSNKEFLSFKSKSNNMFGLTDFDLIIDKKIDSLNGLGYINLKTSKKVTTNKHISYIYQNNKIEYVSIYINDSILNFLNNNLEINKYQSSAKVNFIEIEEYLKSTTKEIASLGYPFNFVQLINIEEINNNLSAELKIDLNSKRKIDRIIIKGYEDFPLSFIKHFIRLKENDVFNIEEIKEKSFKINNLKFVQQYRDPEILFERDSTITYLYLNKIKNNRFDGYIGFNNSDNSNEIEINGYVDLSLLNSFNKGEEIKLNYRNNGAEKQYLIIDFNIPYIFNGPIGLNGSINLTKKDSSYTKDEQFIGINYLTKKNKKLILNLNTVNSNSNTSNNSSLIKDFKSKFIKFEFKEQKSNFENELIPIKFFNSIELFSGQRKDNLGTEKQIKLKTVTYNNFKISKKINFFIKLETFNFISKSYYLNELNLFGGINSIRGFEENSLNSNKHYIINSEFRFSLDNTIYINTIFDAAYFENKLTIQKEHLYSFGLGLNLKTDSGIFKLIYANGTVNGNPVDLKTSKIHLSFTNIF